MDARKLCPPEAFYVINHYKRKLLANNYSGTPPYDHPVITATLFLPQKKLSQPFSYSKNPFNTTTLLMRPIFHGQKVVVLTCFHCIGDRKRGKILATMKNSRFLN